MRKDLVVVPSYSPRTIRIGYNYILKSEGGKSYSAMRPAKIMPHWVRRQKRYGINRKLAKYVKLEESEPLEAFYFLKSQYDVKELYIQEIMQLSYDDLNKMPRENIRLALRRIEHLYLYRYITTNQARHITTYNQMRQITNSKDLITILNFAEKNGISLKHLSEFNEEDLRRIKLIKQPSNRLRVKRYITFGEEVVFEDENYIFIVQYMEVREPIIAYLTHNNVDASKIQAVSSLFEKQGSTSDYDAYLTTEARRLMAMNNDDLRNPIGKGWHKEIPRHRRAAKIGHIRRKLK